MQIEQGGELLQGHRPAAARSEALSGARGGKAAPIVSLSAIRRGGWWLIFAAAVTVAALNSRFLWHDVRTIMERAADHIPRDTIKLYMHLTTAPIILVTGAINFKPGLRQKRPRVHRWIGRVYLGAILVTAPLTFVMSLHETEGPLTVFGFGILSLLWFVSGAIAWWHAWRGRYRLHGEWMVRNYALTLTNVTFRVELHIMLLCGASFNTVYELTRISQFIPNLLIAEWLIRSGALTTNSWSRLLAGIPILPSRRARAS